MVILNWKLRINSPQLRLDYDSRKGWDWVYSITFGLQVCPLDRYLMMFLKFKIFFCDWNGPLPSFPNCLEKGNSPKCCCWRYLWTANNFPSVYMPLPPPASRKYLLRCWPKPNTKSITRTTPLWSVNEDTKNILTICSFSWGEGERVHIYKTCQVVEEGKWILI